MLTEAPAGDIDDINTALSDAVSILGGSGAALSYNNGTTTYDEWLVGLNDIFEFVPRVKDDLKDISSVDNMHHCATEMAKFTEFIAVCADNILSCCVNSCNSAHNNGNAVKCYKFYHYCKR